MLEAQHLEEQLAVGSERFAESLTYFPDVEHGGPEEHLMWVEKARKAVKMPLIASLNAVNPGTWATYARKLEETGVDGLELNVYAIPTEAGKTAVELETELFEIIDSVLKDVEIPVSVKLSAFFTSPLNVIHGLAGRGVKAVVLFNRFLQPDIDPSEETLKSEMVLSSPEEMKVPLRHISLLFGRVDCDLALTSGVHSGLDAAKAILAGATVVQTASALLKNGIPYLSTMLRELEGWMVEKGYENLEAFRGKLSQRQVEDPFAFERDQYVKLLMSQK